MDLRFVVFSFLLVLSIQRVNCKETNNSTGDLRLCGRRLISTITRVCNHRYVNKFDPILNIRRVKRAVGLTNDCCASKCSLEYIRTTICAQ